MNEIEVFFWFCKEQKIMDLMFKIYHSRKFGIWKYDNGSYFEPFSLKEFLKYRIERFGFNDIFWDFESKNCDLMNNPRYKKAKSKWNAFAKNNVILSDKFINIGDRIEFILWNREFKGIIVKLDKKNCGVVTIRQDDEIDFTTNILFCRDIKVNNINKKPTFYIKRRKKVYGTNKR